MSKILLSERHLGCCECAKPWGGLHEEAPNASARRGVKLCHLKAPSSAIAEVVGCSITNLRQTPAREVVGCMDTNLWKDAPLMEDGRSQSATTRILSIPT